jgi:hypothetical protein
MGVAFTNLENTFNGPLDATDPDTFLAELHSVLSIIGWDSLPYENGHRYLLTNPIQGLSCNLRIWYKDETDPTYPNCYAFQFLSSYDDPLEGHVHHLQVAAEGEFVLHPFTDYWVWANECQIFVAEPGRTQTGIFPRSVCGGVPFALDEIGDSSPCQAQSPNPAGPTTELWWSAGDDAGDGWDGGTVESFRTGHYNRRYSFCRNAVLTSPTFAVDGPALQLATCRPGGYDADRYWSGWESGFVFFADGEPLRTDSILVHDYVMVGQLPDSCLLTRPMELEATEGITETEANEDGTDRITYWQNWTKNFTNHKPKPTAAFFDDGRLYSLLLLDGDLTMGRLGNIAY